MKTYRIQRLIDRDWEDFPGIETQSIQYARGYQDAVHHYSPHAATRIVWVRGSRYEVVRVRNRPGVEAPK